MANFDVMDDDYGDMFITQTSKDDQVVSLEEDNCFKLVKSDNYSDISDFEDKTMEHMLR